MIVQRLPRLTTRRRRTTSGVHQDATPRSPRLGKDADAPLVIRL
jgi:hypothetical protein